MLPVVYDFRAADVAAGGEGAPFVPLYHRALARKSGLAGDVVVVNIGGVANITRIGADGSLAAGDTGPGNALIDDFVRARTGGAMDQGGELAARGTVDDIALAALTADPWFEEPLPKSLDRDAFSARCGRPALDGRRGGDARRVHRYQHRGGDRHCRRRRRDRGVRRRRPQSGHRRDDRDGDQGGGQAGKRPRVGRGFRRGAGVRLSGGTERCRTAAQLAGNHRRIAADAGRGHRQTVRPAEPRRVQSALQISSMLSQLSWV